eukprot:Hpha_TRINITY_DN30889_c0_g1::TRINITY_DN30889_c0_g1_i1::g.155739::m.155739/K04874/KCNA1; potassium voltage-gated channel Shaker-related subfamily A member 1
MSVVIPMISQIESSESDADSRSDFERGWPGWSDRDERQGLSEKMHRMICEVSPSGRLGLSQFRTLYMNIFPQRTLDERAWQETKRVYKEILGLPPQTDHVSLEKIILWLDVERQEREDLARSRPTTKKQWVWALVGSDDIEFDSDKEPFHIRFGIPFTKMVSQIMIVLSVLIVIIESLPDYQQKDDSTGEWSRSGTTTTFEIEATCIVYFTVELILYTWSYPRSCFNYFTAVDTWINLATCIPFYLAVAGVGVEASSAMGVRVVRLMRVLRVLRSLRLARVRGNREGRFPSLIAGLKKARMPLYMLLIVILIAVVFLASVMYLAEHEETNYNFEIQKWMRNNDSGLPDRGLPVQFQSIPDAMWWSGWAVVGSGPDRSSDTGDQYPITLPGKFIAIIAMIGCLLVVSYAVVILQGAFAILTEDNLRIEWRDQIRQEWVETLGDPRNSIGSENLAAPQPGVRFTCSAPLTRLLRDVALDQGLGAEAVPALEASLTCAVEALKSSRFGFNKVVPQEETLKLKKGDLDTAPRWAVTGRFDPDLQKNDMMHVHHPAQGNSVVKLHSGQLANSSLPNPSIIKVPSTLGPTSAPPSTFTLAANVPNTPSSTEPAGAPATSALSSAPTPVASTPGRGIVSSPPGPGILSPPGGLRAPMDGTSNSRPPRRRPQSMVRLAIPGEPTPVARPVNPLRTQSGLQGGLSSWTAREGTGQGLSSGRGGDGGVV